MVLKHDILIEDFHHNVALLLELLQQLLLAILHPQVWLLNHWCAGFLGLKSLIDGLLAALFEELSKFAVQLVRPASRDIRLFATATISRILVSIGRLSRVLLLLSVSWSQTFNQ